VLSIVALVTIVVVAAIWWRAGLGELFRPQTAVRPAPQQQQQAPAQPAAPAPQPEPVTQAQAEPPKSEPPAAATPPELATTVAPAGDGNFTVQVRSSPDESDARAAAQALGAAGVEAYVVRADLGARGVWYRVRIGRYATRDEASQAAVKLRSSGRVSDAIVQSYEAP
jgi:cell division septation protein DedD